MGLDARPYEPRYRLINESLLGRRNKIAHGEWLDLDESGFVSLVDDVLILLRMFKTDIENSVALQGYLAS